MTTRFLSFVAPARARATRTPLDCDLVIRGFESIDDPYDDAQYLGSNNVDADFDIDSSAEFGDSDGTDDLRGLTVHEFDTVLDAVRFLNGYAVK